MTKPDMNDTRGCFCIEYKDSFEFFLFSLCHFSRLEKGIIYGLVENIIELYFQFSAHKIIFLDFSKFKPRIYS